MTVPEGRRRLEKTLASPALTDKESVYRLVYNQLAASYAHSESHGEDRSVNNKSILDLAQSRFLKLWDLLELLRSASENEYQNHGFTNAEEASAEGWKLKQDTGQMRSMYREGPEGTPFHTLLAEGLIYGPIVNALCLGWEAPSYKLWWPQMTVPTFKIIESQWVKRGSIGEDLSLIRVKVPWPLSTREVLMHAFELEYFEEDLIIVLLHSIQAPPDISSIEGLFPGLKPSDIPDVLPTTVRMDLSGGFALQRLTAEQSYFRTVVNLDVKLDFVPPWLINFISRQLVGLGFKLYQNTLTSINNNEGNSQIFKGLIETEPMYNRVKLNFQSRKAGRKTENEQNLFNESNQKRSPKSSDVNLEMPTLVEEKISHDSELATIGDDISTIVTHESACETEERDAGGNAGICEALPVDSEVLNALQILDKLISLVHGYGSGLTKSSTSITCTGNSTGSSQNLSASSVKVLHNSTNPVSRTRLGKNTDDQQVWASQNVPQDLEELVPALQLMSSANEHSANGMNSHVLGDKEHKVKRSCSCF